MRTLVASKVPDHLLVSAEFTPETEKAGSGDFESHENTAKHQFPVRLESWQLTIRHQRGLVLIQTGNTTQNILHKVVNNDYAGYYNDEIKERESYFYPPFTRVISITVKHEEQEKAEKAAHWLADKLLEKLGKARVLGPEKAMVERVRNKFLFDILIKLEKDKLNIKAAKVFLQEKIDEVMLQREFRGMYVVVDVDAV